MLGAIVLGGLAVALDAERAPERGRHADAMRRGHAGVPVEFELEDAARSIERDALPPTAA